MQFRLTIIMIIKVALGAFIVAACTTGCPNSGGESGVKTIAAAPDMPSGMKTPANEPSTEGEVDAPAEVQASDANIEEEPVAAEVKVEFPERTGDPSLGGKWFALFGHHDLGLLKHSWVDGHNVEFRQNGQAFWYRVVNGAEVDTMDSQWSMQSNGQLKLSFSATSAKESGLSNLAPLGIGNDEEIGLASGSVSGGNASAMVLLDSVMDIQLDHHYLVIRDNYERLMVYGREPNNEPEIPGSINGAWIGKGSSDRQFEAQFELSGQKLDGVMGRLSTEFSGVFAKGYFVGEMMSPKGIELVAFYYDDLGFLDGVRYTRPFRVVTMDYEFVKSPE